MWQQITTTVFWWCSTYRWALTQLFHVTRTNISLSTSTWQPWQQLEVGSDIHKGPQQHCLLSCLVWENLSGCTQHLWDKQQRQLWSRRGNSRPSGLNIPSQNKMILQSIACVAVLWSLRFKEICTRKLWNGYNSDYDMWDVVTVRQLTHGVRVKEGLLWSANPDHLCD